MFESKDGRQTTADGKPVIELAHVSFSYGYAGATEVQALSDITLSVQPSDFMGILGPSGAGKSTLASVMSGAIPHHFSGQLFGATYVEGSDTCDITLTDIARIVGSVLQDIDTQMVASVVEDEMLFGLENFGMPHDKIAQRVGDTLDAVGIADLRDREIATLSGGQKQKVAIAAILALTPRVLILDAPTAALDPASSLLVFDTLRAINEQQGVTIVVIEQKVALLSEYCNRIAVLDHGHLVLEGTPHEVFAHGSELRRIGVDSPRVARISNSLISKGLLHEGYPCLNVGETVALITGLVGKHQSNSQSKQQATSTDETGSTNDERPKSEGADPVVNLRDVSFAYPGATASVRHLELVAYPGEFVGVVGQNGAGKTTLMKLLNGLLKPDTGSVCISGLDTREVPTSRIAAHCATLFQNPDRQLCKDTVLDEVAFGLELQGVASQEAHDRSRDVVEQFGLPFDEAPFALSRGQRQMVALASVVVTQPDVVLLDEPTSELDYRECMTVMETVADMARRGCAVIMVCHDMEVVSDFAERIVVMSDGEILARGQTHALFADESLMRQASVAPPQTIELSTRLAREVSPVFAGMSEVSDIVDTTEEMIRRG